jgi:hypothetical protein
VTTSALQKLTDAPWGQDVVALIAGRRPPHPAFDGTGWPAAARELGGWSEPRHVRVVVSQAASEEQVLDYIASMSWVAALDDDERHALLREARRLVTAKPTPPALPVSVAMTLAQRL